jgi:hypothetical protein
MVYVVHEEYVSCCSRHGSSPFCGQVVSALCLWLVVFQLPKLGPSPCLQLLSFTPAT